MDSYNKEDEKLEEDNKEEQDSEKEVVQQAPPLVKEKKKKKDKELELLLDEKGKRERGKTIQIIMRPMGKLHNHVVHICSSANRMTWFVEHASKMIPLDNRTRWNS
jgi:hypothetical protein